MEHAARLKQHLTKLAEGGLCVAFSGGVDSAVLLHAACAAAPGNVHAVTLHTPFHTLEEVQQAVQLARAYGAMHRVITLEELPPEVLQNPPDRCYLCKRSMFARIATYAQEHGLAHVLDGTNADDQTEYRPGLKALAELGVRSPLAELGLSKAQVRALTASQGLTAADKPSAPCLATRFPYHTAIDPALLPRIERMEAAVKAIGPQVVRARVHGDTIRLEVPPEQFGLLLAQREALLELVQSEGFACLTLDLAGYRSGAMDLLFFGEKEE